VAFQVAFTIYQSRNLNTKLLAGDIDALNAITEFRTQVSHQIKRYFRNIRVAASDLESSEFEPIQTIGRRIAEEARQGLDTTTSLLSWLPSGMQPIVFIKPVFVIKELIETRWKSTIAPGIRFDAIVACDENIQIQVKGKLLQWCLDRIVENSQRHGAQNITLTVSRDDGEVIIKVSDDGEGLPPERTVDELYQWTRPWQPQGDGTALPLCRTFIRGMNGEIRSARADTHGLVTVLTLPISTGD
jgi:K+-sensing histidine kinase KdpD